MSASTERQRGEAETNNFNAASATGRGACEGCFWVGQRWKIGRVFKFSQDEMDQRCGRVEATMCQVIEALSLSSTFGKWFHLASASGNAIFRATGNCSPVSDHRATRDLHMGASQKGEQFHGCGSKFKS